jgi:very-short-patch-repair endonuclease
MQQHRPGQPESPIEIQFWNAWQQRVPHLPLVLQYPACGGAYRLDFAYVPARIAIELDGYTHHSSHARFTQDRKRQRDLIRDGWRVLVFSGTEVFHQAERCVDEARATIEQLAGIPAASSLPTPSPQPLPGRARPPAPFHPGVIVGVVLLLMLGPGLVIRPHSTPTAQVIQATDGPLPTSAARSWATLPTATLDIEPPHPEIVQPLNQTPTVPVLRMAHVVPPELNIHATMGVEGIVITRVKQGTSVAILEEQLFNASPWIRIRVQEDGEVIEGWVNGGFLR